MGKVGDTLEAALEREHREIDRGIEAFLADRSSLEPLTTALEALRRHIFLEEEFLFPPLRDAGLFAPIFVMLREHGEIWGTIEAVEASLAAGASDGAADLCRELLGQLERHNFKEEPVLYTQADSVLSAPAAAGLSAFLESGRMPDGWACSGARA